MSEDLMVVPQHGLAEFDLEASLKKAASNLNAIKTFVASAMVDGVDFGKIPGTGDKPCLLKPGAEKLDGLFSCYPQFEFLTVMEDPETGLAFYRVQARLVSRITGKIIGEGVGSCSSYESKYRWRWVPANSLPMMSAEEFKALPSKGGAISEFAFGVERKETSGQYGKPAEYWKKFQDAIDNGTARQIKRKTRKGAMMDAWEIDETVYRQSNPDLMDVWNTVLKIAQKRAHVAAALTLGAVSDLFTQDLEDYVDGEFTAIASGNGGKETKAAAPAPITTPMVTKAATETAYPTSFSPKDAPAAPLHTEQEVDPAKLKQRLVIDLVNGKFYKTPYAVNTKMAELGITFDAACYAKVLERLKNASEKGQAAESA